MLSRVADSLFWVGRYIERAENVARFMDVNLQLVLDAIDDSEDPWRPLVDATGDEKAFRSRYPQENRENVIQFLTFDETNPNSIVSCLKGARENARAVREAISQEMWEQLNRFYRIVGEAAAAQRALVAPHDFFLEIKTASQIFIGATQGTMSRNEAWHFLRLGTMMERADKTSRVLDMKSHLLAASSSRVDVHWSAVLHSVSGLEMYRKRWGLIQPQDVVRFLLLDHEFPRAVHFCLERATESLHAITGTGPGMFKNIAEQRLGLLRSELAYTRVEEVLELGLHDYLDALQTKLNRLGDAIYETFFHCPQPEPVATDEGVLSGQ